MNSQAHSTICTADDILATDEACVLNDPIRNQLGMLDDIAGMADNTRNQNFSVRQLHVLPGFPLMLMPRVCCFDRIGSCFHFEHQIDHMLERQIVRMRSMPASPANVIADTIL